MTAIAAILAARHGTSRSSVAGAVRALMADLGVRGLLDGRAGTGPARQAYELLGVRFAVITAETEVLALLDRLQSRLLARGAREPDVIYAVDRAGDVLRVRSRGVILREAATPLEAALALEWLMADEAADRERDHIHVHGAVVAGKRASILLPAGHRAGKTTIALALRMRGLRLYSDDVAFLDPRTWRPLPLPRSVHVEEDGIARLRKIGLEVPRDRRLGTYVEAAFLAPWPRTPGPAVRHVVLPRIARGARSSLEPAPAAEAAAELIGCSRNVQRAPRFGADVVRQLFAQVRCWRARIGDDLDEAADLLAALT